MFDYINYNDEVIILGYNGNPTEVIIPSEIEGMPVINIGYEAFSHCSKIMNITIPNTIKSIESRAFWKCDNLTNIIIPNSVTSIGEFAFQGCNNLEDIYYTGAEEHWGKIAIDSYNHAVDKAKKHFKNA